MRPHPPKITAGLICAVALAVLAPAPPGISQTAPPPAPQAAHPDAKRPITFADLMALKRISDPQISPSGKWVLFSVTEVSLEKNTKVNHLWVVPLAGGPEHQITSNTGESFGRFSPDGKFVSYTGAPTKEDPVARITIANWDETAGTIGVGRTLKAVSGDADGAIWSPDSKHLLFTTQVYPECSDKPSWSEEDACDKAKDDAADKDPVKAQVWDHLLYRHWNAYTGEKRTHILVIDADGQNPRDLTPRSNVGDAETPTFFLDAPLQYAWSPDSREIAYVTNLDPVPAASTNNDIFTLRLDDRGDPIGKPVKISTSPGSDDAPAYSPDGKYLAFRSQARAGYESDSFRLMLYDRTGQTTRELLPNFDRWVDEFAWGQDAVSPHPVWRIYFASGDSGDEPIFRVKTDGSNLEQLSLPGEYGELHVSLDGSVLVAGRMSVAEPTKLVSIDLEKIFPFVGDFLSTSKIPARYLPPPTDAAIRVGRETQLTHLNDAPLSRLELDGSIDDFTGRFMFAGVDGIQVQGFIVKPPNFDPNKKYPLKFLIHGGPQGAWGDSWSYRWNWQLMAASGYVVVGINPRGSTGYGQKFVEGVSGDWGGKPYTDLMRGLDYAEAHFPFIDKTRECALGASYGGYMANWVLTHTSRFQCIVTHDGLFDPVSAYGSTEEMWFPEWEFRRSPATGAAAWDPEPAQPWRYAALPADQDPFRKWSPLRFIQNAKTPTLIIHSQKDYRLDVSQGFQLFTALQRRNVPSKFLYFPDEGHWVLKPQNSQLWYQTVSDWCDRYTHTNAYAAAK